MAHFRLSRPPLKTAPNPDWGALDLLLGYTSMLASSMSNQVETISVVIAQFKEFHNELRLEVASRDDGSLNWSPCPGANSVATIVTHTLGSEAETLRAVAGVPGSRDRDSEFKIGSQSQADLLAQIRQADSPP